MSAPEESECPTCRGTGLTETHPCNAHASMVDICPDCDGTGTADVCPECGGSGETAGHYFADDGVGPCETCHPVDDEPDWRGP